MALRSIPFALLLLVPLLPAVAHGQTPGDRDLIRERQERLLQEQERRLDELRQLPGSAPDVIEAPAPTDEQCFAIEQISLSGARSDVYSHRYSQANCKRKAAVGRPTHYWPKH